MRFSQPHSLICRIFISLLIALTPYKGLSAVPVTLVPLPAHMTESGGEFLLGPKTIIRVLASPGGLAAADLLARRLRVATGYPLPVKAKTAVGLAPPNTIVLTTAGADLSLGKEGYTLAVTPSTIMIRAPYPAGLFYATQTLRQLLPAQIESQSRCSSIVWRVPGVHIWDRPRFPVRGLMIDSSRHMQSISFLKKTLDEMAYHKLNTFHWHLTDDQGWRLEIKRYPKLTQVGAWRNENGHAYGGFYTQAQVRDIVAYAAMRQITIVPEIDMPAHSHPVLAAYPDLGCTHGPFSVLNVGQYSEDVMNPSKPETYRFIDGVLAEVISLFPSKAIHIGGDECPKAEWKASPECQALIREKGLKDEYALQNYFTRQIAAFLTAHGRRLQGWNEILQGGTLPKDVIVQQWSEPQAASVAAQAGNDVVVSSSSYVYFDSSHDAIPLQKVYAFNPIPADLSPTLAKHILGVEACLWTETKPTDAIANEYIWPRLIAVAEVGWSPVSERDWAGFEARLRSSQYPRLSWMGLDTSEALLERSDFNWGVRIGAWTPAEMSEQWSTRDWDVTPFLDGPGQYTIHFNYEGGADAISIASAELLRDGQSTTKDIHPGWTGGVSHGRMYRLSLVDWSRAAHYTLRVQLRSEGGIDSRGALWLAGPVKK